MFARLRLGHAATFLETQFLFCFVLSLRLTRFGCKKERERGGERQAGRQRQRDRGRGRETEILTETERLRERHTERQRD